MIEKITNQNLERYDSRLKEWCDKKFFEKGNYGKYQTTEEAGAVAFYPAPNTPLEGKVKFSFKEAMPAEGVKGPENPSIITGVENIKITRCGKNLIKTPFFSTSNNYVVNKVTFTLNHNDGTLTANGTASPNDARLYFVGATSRIRLLGGKQYRLSGCPSGGSSNTYAIGASCYTIDGITYLSSLPSDTGSGVLWDIATDCSFVSSVWVKAGTEVSNLVFKPQIELGSVITNFESYTGTDYTVNLGDTYYGGEIDLATGVMTVTHEGVVLTGEEDFWRFGTEVETSGIYRHVAQTAFSSNVIANNTQICSHFSYVYSWYSQSLSFYASSRGINFFSGISTLDNFKSWVAAQYTNNTPLTVVAPLVTPYIVQLIPSQILSLAQIDKYTPRLNTVYTDADSVQISYLKSPIRDEYEKTQAILSLGGNS